jgi:hypothetical protein
MQAADIVNLLVSFSIAVARRDAQLYLRQPQGRRDCAAAARYLCSWALELVQQEEVVLPMQDVCAMANALPGLQRALGSNDSVFRLAHATARQAAARIRQGEAHAPPIVRSWCDLLYGLTKAGLVVNTELNASLAAVKEHSPDLQYLLDQGAQQLPALLEKDGAVAQDVSMTLLAYAYAGYTGDLGPVTQALASNLRACLQRAAPQGITNILWALGKLCSMQQPGAYNREVFSYLVSQVCSHVQARDAKVTAQDISNTVYGCALAGHTEGVPQLLDAVCQMPEVLESTNPQDWSNTIWAVATLHDSAVEQGDRQLADAFRGYGHKLLSACASTPGALRGATPQALSNVLWAASDLRWYNQRFFTDTAAALLTAGMDVTPQNLSNMLLACAVCAHWDSHVHQLLVSVTSYDLQDFSEQGITNTLYTWAVLTCIAREAGAGQQQVQELGQVAGALFEEAWRRWEQNHGVCNEVSLCQLFQAHMYAEHLGLPQRLEGELLSKARDAWCTWSHTTSRGQQEVNSTLQQMGYTTEPHATTADGLFRPDITITNGTSRSMAVEFDGPHHYVREHRGNGTAIDRLNGPTRLRNVLLRPRSPGGVLFIPVNEWAPAFKAGQQREYLRKALADPLSLKAPGQSDAITWTGSHRGAHHTPAQAQPSGDQGSTSDACRESHPSSMPAAADRSHGFNPDDIEADRRQLEQALHGREEQLPDKH